MKTPKIKKTAEEMISRFVELEKKESSNEKLSFKEKNVLTIHRKKLNRTILDDRTIQRVGRINREGGIIA